MQIQPASSIRGTIHLPGDKSISHRYAVLAAMATGNTTILNFSNSQDCKSTLNCLQKIGVEIHHQKNELKIQSRGWTKFQQPTQILNAGNSGTTIRFLSALLSGSPFNSTIQGDSSLNLRPMERIIVPLSQMGASIEAHKEEYPPLHIKGASLKGINYHLPLASAQVKSCLLLAGLMAQGQTTIEEATSTRNHTELALPFFNTSFTHENGRMTISGQSSLTPVQAKIPGDFSAAAFFILSALLVPNSEIRLVDVGINPSRTALLDLLEQAGLHLEKTNLRLSNSEPICDLTIRYTPSLLEKFPTTIQGKQIPNLIDEIPILAILGTRLKRGLIVRQAEELRKKESDRIHSTVLNLRNTGIQVEEFPDGFAIPPGQHIGGGKIQSLGDHRIAMAFSIAGLISTQPIEIDNPDCVAVSFPEFFEVLQSIVVHS